jgi:hypothetical protein
VPFRSTHSKILSVRGKIADLHLAEAIGYRSLDRDLWV